MEKNKKYLVWFHDEMVILNDVQVDQYELSKLLQLMNLEFKIIRYANELDLMLYKDATNEGL